MFLIVMGWFAAAQLVEAHIDIEAGATRTVVVAEYVFSRPVENLTFDAIRWPGQALLF